LNISSLRVVAVAAQFVQVEVGLVDLELEPDLP
jgi:hypothetical protein